VNNRAVAAAAHPHASLRHSVRRPDAALSGRVKALQSRSSISSVAEMTTAVVEGNRLEHSSYANARCVKVTHNDFDLDVSFESKTIRGAATVSQPMCSRKLFNVLWIVMLCCGTCLPHLRACCLQITLKATEDGVSSVVLDTRDLRIQGIFAEDGSRMQHHMGEHSDVSHKCIIRRCTRRHDGWRGKANVLCTQCRHSALH
jgi:hypothetical protein